VFIKKSIAFQIEINDNYRWFDGSQLLWVKASLLNHNAFDYILPSKVTNIATNDDYKHFFGAILV
jgi:hypothetical protein